MLDWLTNPLMAFVPYEKSGTSFAPAPVLEDTGLDLSHITVTFVTKLKSRHFCRLDSQTHLAQVVGIQGRVAASDVIDV